ncbi:Ubiquitin domain-containing protein DSK2b [Sesamum angolense]|uniref:Ubiquitin domain-containing protein DSK2b n=1 Tax=Sesamum angolense TaxID=2727404 RepID=A0AAE1WX83_9LAMI|nr:Ubiquitin domain-containing protein DSK2b [Sesamum angolense]
MGAEGQSSAAVAACEEVNVNIRCSNGSKFSVKTTLDSTVAEFKALLAQNCDVPAEQQRLIYKGLQADHTVHMVRGSAPAASPPTPAPTSTGNTNSTAATQGAGPNAGGTGIAGAGASPFPGLGLGALGGAGASGVFGAGLPEFEQVQQQLTQNPNMMREIMNMPAIQSLMNNPEIMRSLIMSNPQMREIIDRNPELAHILNDPSILRQTLEAARNPELMREMMRNTDRAMSNIESSPEGFNMLRRMYENVQEPFLNASTMGGGAATDASNPFAALLGNQGGAQTRDGSNSSTAGLETGTTPQINNTGGSQTNNSARTNQSGDARLPGIAGLGGLSLPELERMGMADSSAFGQLLQNPAVAQMMQSLLSNPQYMDQILGLNPQLHSMLDMNPQLREMMQNPEILRELTSPETMQQMMALQQQLSQLARQQSTPLTVASIPLPKSEGEINGLVEVIYNYTEAVYTSSPEELYATQLSQLQEMGFFDTQENIRALRATSGNVHAAVERLLGNLVLSLAVYSCPYRTPYHSIFFDLIPYSDLLLRIGIFIRFRLLMVQQTKESSFTEYGLGHADSGLSNSDKQLSVSMAAKTPEDSRNENLMTVSKSIFSPLLMEDRACVGEVVRVSGTKRPIPECLRNPAKSNAGSAHIVKSTDHGDKTQQLMEMNEPAICTSDVAPSWKASSMSFSSTRRSLSPSLGMSCNTNIASPENIEHVHVNCPNPSSEDPVTANVKLWEERYCRLQSLLKMLDQSDQYEYVHLLRSLSSVELSRHAIELEKRSMKLSLEEAKEIERVGFIDVFGVDMGRMLVRPLLSKSSSYTIEVE